MNCLVLSNCDKNILDQIDQWLNSIDKLETSHCQTLPCVTHTSDYDKVLIVIDDNQAFTNSMLEVIEYLNNLNDSELTKCFVIIDNPALPPSLRYFILSDKDVSDNVIIPIKSSKDIIDQLIGYEFRFE